MTDNEPKDNQKGEMGMADFDSYSESFKSIQPGQYLTGKIVKVEKDGVLVDVGYKTEGFIPLQELSHNPFANPQDLVKPGEEIEVVVLKVEGAEGELILSKKRADLEGAWKKLTKAFETQEAVTGTVVEQVKGGLIVDLGLRGFLPASQVDLMPVRDLGEFVGEALKLKVIEIDRSRRKVVLSRRKVLEEERLIQKSKVLQNLFEGMICEGTVARVTDFGAFVNMGGIDGLVHISELSWRRIKHPSEVVKIGDKVEVLILKIDPKKERISLSLRQAKPDPWQNVHEKFREGEICKGTVTKLAKNYTFVELAEGVEGVIPMVELVEGKIVKPEDLLSAGQVLNVKVLEIKPSERRITLSLRQAESEKSKEKYRNYLNQGGTGTFKMEELLKKSEESSKTE